MGLETVPAQPIRESEGRESKSLKKRQKLRVLCDFLVLGDLCGNPAVESLKLRVFCEFFGRLSPS